MRGAYDLSGGPTIGRVRYSERESGDTYLNSAARLEEWYVRRAAAGE